MCEDAAAAGGRGPRRRADVLGHEEEMAPDDPHLRWIEEHLDELRCYPSTWVAIDPVRGIVVHAKDGDEFADKLAALPSEERKRLLTFNTSMCA